MLDLKVSKLSQVLLLVGLVVLVDLLEIVVSNLLNLRLSDPVRPLFFTYLLEPLPLVVVKLLETSLKLV